MVCSASARGQSTALRYPGSFRRFGLVEPSAFTRWTSSSSPRSSQPLVSGLSALGQRVLLLGACCPVCCPPAGFVARLNNNKDAVSSAFEVWPREESNLRARIRSPSLYPLSYGALCDGARGVTDGTRTHNHRDHNPGLYQLSYGHLATQRIAQSLRALTRPQAAFRPVRREGPRSSRTPTPRPRREAPAPSSRPSARQPSERLPAPRPHSPTACRRP